MKPDPRIVVKKFGGTSVGSLERIESVAARLEENYKNGEHPVVVVSAMAGETNRLVGMAETIMPGERGPAYDMLLATGEQVSVSLVSLALQKRGLKPRPLLAFQLGIQTDSKFAKARIQNINSDLLKKLVGEGFIPVVAGFQGVSEDDQITTLGRGGSDTTAVALAAAMSADECEIYTDVPAVFSADPRLVPRAREIAKLSWEEMMEMSSLGSKVLHIRSVEIALKYEVRLHLRSTFEKRSGTWVVSEGEVMEHPLVSSVTHEMGTSVFKLFPVPSGSSFLADFFEMLAERGVVVDIITQSGEGEHQRLAFSVSQEDQPLAESILQSHLAALSSGIQVERMTDMAKVSVVGVGMRNHPGVAARFFSVLSELNVPIHLVTTSEIKISAVIPGSQLQIAAQKLHQRFDLDRV